MAHAYRHAADRAVLFEDEPITNRVFALFLTDPQRVKYDAEHDTIDAIIEADQKELGRYERIALRTQVIDNPLQPVQIGTKILQFFAVNPNADALRDDRRMSGFLTELVDGEETPLYFLNRDEVWALAHGDGFAVSVQLEALIPAAKKGKSK